MNFINRQMIFFLIFTVIWCCISKDVLGLRHMMLKVPKAVKSGISVTLCCDYDLESAALYIIKWFKNEEEFYRYVPKESPPSQIFPLPNLNVDVSKSNWKEVTLTNVSRDTTGEFKCEVTADAPLFHTDFRTSVLLVADILEEDVVMKSDVYKIIPGEYIQVNCTAPGSIPKMNITWFLNDLEINSTINGDVRIEKSTTYSHPFQISHSMITLKSEMEFFKQGKFTLRCLATLFDLYRKAKDLEILEDATQQALIMDFSNNIGSSIKLPLSNNLKFFIIFYITLRK